VKEDGDLLAIQWHPLWSLLADKKLSGFLQSCYILDISVGYSITA